MVMHGPADPKGNDDEPSFDSIRAQALREQRPPAHGGDEIVYLHAFLDARKKAMMEEEAHAETDRVDTMQRKFLKEQNIHLQLPLSWSIYGDSYTIHG
jgi:chitosanase